MCSTRGRRVHAISEEEFGKLMQDETFVDFFNVFLSLPSFSQRLMYIYDKKTFQFDPPIKRHNQVLQKQSLIKWLVEERYPYFMDSDYYLEFQLCKQLLTVKPHFSTSSHKLDYEDFRVLEDKNFVKASVGHVVGMCHFRSYLSGSSGGKVLEFWKDAERFHLTKNRSIRRAIFRQIQLKYFKPQGLVRLEDHNLWQTLKDGAAAVDFDLDPTPNQSLPTFHDLQNRVMTLLQHYWLQKYLLHQVSLQRKLTPPPEDACRVRSLSDLHILKDLADIDKALAVALGSTHPNKRTHDTTAKTNWAAMFPHVEVDDSFLTPTDSVVTSHNNGNITIRRPGPEFEEMLDRYFCSTPSSSSSETDVSIDMASTADVPVPTDSKRVWDIAPVVGTTLKDYEEATRLLVSKIAEVEMKRKSKGLVREENLVLFEQLADLTGGAWPESDDCRPRTSETQPREIVSPATGSMHTGFHLPSIENPKRKSKRQKALKKCAGSTAAVQTLDSLGEEPSVGEEQGVNVTPVEFTYTNLSAGNYRYDNKVLVRALAVDMLAGRPFLAFLTRYRHKQELCAARLWAELHAYLSIPATVRDIEVTNRLRHWRGHRIINRFLSGDNQSNSASGKGCGLEFVPLPEGVAASVRNILIQGKVDNLLTHVQDYLSQGLHALWKSFVHIENEKFLEAAMMEKPGGRIHGSRYTPTVPSIALIKSHSKSLPPLAQATPSRYQRRETETIMGGPIPVKKKRRGDTGTNSRQRSQTQSSRKESPTKETNEETVAIDEGEEEGARGPENLFITQESHKGLLERRMWRATQLATYVTGVDSESLLMEPLPLTELEYNGDGMSGSLALKKLIIMRRRDLVEAEERRRAVKMATYTNKMALLKAKEVENLPPEVLDENVSEWAKPFKGENQRWVFRPSRPRTFSEIFKNPYSIEFFKRYLQAHGGVVRLNFWVDVESMKMAKDSTFRQQKISQILRRYFLSQKGYAALDCNDEVIKEIPKMEKVTPAMLISGQSCIAKLIEDKWFSQYQSTFPELEPENEVFSSSQKENKRTWTTSRSRELWINFLKTVMRFRHAIMDKELVKQFGQYLKKEILKETERQKASGGISYVPGLPIKKVIRNRLIDVTKLLDDLTFLAEAERFRSLCDYAAEAARQGIYRTGDQQLLDMKAKTIIQCYLDSDIPPRIQVNASSEAVDGIIANFQSGFVDRGLFHDANMNIFPVMAYLWKKFQRIRVANMLIKAKETDVPPVVKNVSSINFLDLSAADSKKFISLHEDDPPRMMFSLCNGLRLYTAPTRDQLLRRAMDTNRAGKEGDAAHGDRLSRSATTLHLQSRRDSAGSAGSTDYLAVHRISARRRNALLVPKEIEE